MPPKTPGPKGPRPPFATTMQSTPTVNTPRYPRPAAQTPGTRRSTRRNPDQLESMVDNPDRIGATPRRPGSRSASNASHVSAASYTEPLNPPAVGDLSEIVEVDEESVTERSETESEEDITITVTPPASQPSTPPLYYDQVTAPTAQPSDPPLSPNELIPTIEDGADYAGLNDGDIAGSIHSSSSRRTWRLSTSSLERHFRPSPGHTLSPSPGPGAAAAQMPQDPQRSWWQIFKAVFREALRYYRSGWSKVSLLLAPCLLMSVLCSAGPMCKNLGRWDVLSRQFKAGPFETVALLIVYALLISGLGDVAKGMVEVARRVGVRQAQVNADAVQVQNVPNPRIVAGNIEGPQDHDLVDEQDAIRPQNPDQHQQWLKGLDIGRRWILQSVSWAYSILSYLDLFEVDVDVRNYLSEPVLMLVVMLGLCREWLRWTHGEVAFLITLAVHLVKWALQTTEIYYDLRRRVPCFRRLDRPLVFIFLTALGLITFVLHARACLRLSSASWRAATTFLKQEDVHLGGRKPATVSIASWFVEPTKSAAKYVVSRIYTIAPKPTV